jgi:hypothetical protein
MKITDAGLAPLMERGPLKRLSIRQTDVSDEFIAKLKEKFPKLDVQTESEDRRRWVEGIQKAGGKLKLITRQGKLIELAPGDPQPTTGFTVRSVDISNYKGFDRFSMLYWQDILGEMSEINLADSSFSGAGFKDFVKATKMATIIATNTNVVDAHLELFPKLPSLKRLDLRGTAVTAPAVQKVKQRLPNGCVVQFGDNEE